MSTANEIPYLGHNYPRDPKTAFRWNAIPHPPPKIEEHILHPRWIDLVWWDETRQVWVYISTRPNPNHETEIPGPGG